MPSPRTLKTLIYHTQKLKNREHRSLVDSKEDSLLPCAEIGPNDHGDQAPHFIKNSSQGQTAIFSSSQFINDLYNQRKLAKSGLDLDGFIGEIGMRQKSFDLRQKFV